MDIYELATNLKLWRAQRAIDTKSSMQAQLNCLAEENLELMDAIGDCAVCVINAEALGFDTNKAAGELERLKWTADVAGVEFNDCLQMAWDEIKDRVGIVLDNGKFTKWANLTHVQRLEVAASGQMLGKPLHVLHACEECCTAGEWSEIFLVINS
jgi:hypothetical protein